MKNPVEALNDIKELREKLISLQTKYFFSEGFMADEDLQTMLFYNLGKAEDACMALFIELCSRQPKKKETEETIHA